MSSRTFEDLLSNEWRGLPENYVESWREDWNTRREPAEKILQLQAELKAAIDELVDDANEGGVVAVDMTEYRQLEEAGVYNIWIPSHLTC